MREVKVFIDVSQLDTQARKDKALRARDNFEKIVNHPRFKEEVSKYKTGRGDSGITFDNGLDYWKKFVESDELVTKEGIDYEVEMEIRDYYSWKGVIGYMTPNRRGTYVNTKFFDSSSDKDVLSNFVHEHAHHLGFYHRSGTFLRESFPYFLNKVIDKLYDEIILGSEPEPVPQYKTVCYKTWWAFWRGFQTCRRVRIN